MAVWELQPLSLSFPLISLKEKCTGVHLGCGGLGDGPAPSLLGVCFLKGARTPLVPVGMMLNTRPYFRGHIALEKG